MIHFTMVSVILIGFYHNLLLGTVACLEDPFGYTCTGWGHIWRSVLCRKWSLGGSWANLKVCRRRSWYWPRGWSLVTCSIMGCTALLHGRHVTLLRVVEHSLLRRLGLWHRTSCLLASGSLWLTIEPWVDHSRCWHRRSYRSRTVEALRERNGRQAPHVWLRSIWLWDLPWLSHWYRRNGRSQALPTISGRSFEVCNDCCPLHFGRLASFRVPPMFLGASHTSIIFGPAIVCCSPLGFELD
jgi:hypothetical protein